MLYNGLIGHTKDTARYITPVCGIKPDRGLLECLAGAAESKEAFCIETGEDKNENVKWQIYNGGSLVCHLGLIVLYRAL